MKIGIITFYHDMTNYGANLQAYALCEVVNKMGYEAEQIDYYNGKRYRYLLSVIYRFVFKKKYYKNKDFYNRKMAIKRFRQSIPHSKVYFKSTLTKANRKYDGFICGSDQIWNPDWITPAFALQFAEDKKLKISYAASIGKEIIEEHSKEKYVHMLSRLDYVSVREKNAVKLLNEFTEKPIEWVLDPTLLLTKNEWDEIVPENKIKDKYVFCYFLNDYKLHRDIAQEYADNNNLKIVTLPYLSYQRRECDDGFGDYRLFDVSPCDFIAMIKYAEYVFTDSFHASVFCHLYNKSFVVFTQGGKESRVRMDSLTELFDTSEHHIVGDDLINLENINGISNVPSLENTKEYQRMKAKSIDYLSKALASGGGDYGSSM